MAQITTIGRKEDPLRLDMFQNPIEIHWVTAGMAALQFEEQHQPAGLDPLTLHGLPFTNTEYDLTQPVAFEERDGNGNLRMWKSIPFRQNFGTEGSLVRGFVFFNLRYIKPSVPQDGSDKGKFIFKVRTPAGGFPITTSNTFYWLWGDHFGASSLEENEANPFTTGDPFSPFPPTDPRSVMAIPRAFFTAAAAAQYLAVLDSSYHVTPRVETNTFTPSVTWRLTLAGYRDRTEFPVDSEGNAGWNEGEAVSGAAATRTGNASNPLEQKIVTFKIHTTTLAATVSVV